MATQFEIDCALMAGRVYQTTRGEVNWFPIPDGWSEFFHVPDPANPSFQATSGFEAVSFIKGSEIVISYAGTNPASLDDWLTNFPLAFGVASDQLRQAAEYYLQIKAANPNATISFTGHSLGGGLASLMAVFFSERAITFDQAPFAASATTLMRDDLINYLKNTAHYSDSDLIMLAPGLIGFTSLAERESHVTGFNTQGEFLTVQSLFNRIGAQTLLEQGTTDLSLMFDLHSQALLSTFLKNPSFESVTFKLPDLVGMTFDNTFYNNPTSSPDKENFIERLIRHEFGNALGMENPTPDAMLTRFTHDLWKLAQEGGLTMKDGSLYLNAMNDVSKALMAFAMQKYYEEQTGSAGYGKELYTQIAGGIRFDMRDVAATLDQAKGYTQYFQNYLNNGLVFTAAEREFITEALPGMRDWYVQAGDGGMNTGDIQNRGAFMLGGENNDALGGGSEADLLVGNVGEDWLVGNAGNDLLIGGKGHDTLYGDGVVGEEAAGDDTLVGLDAAGELHGNDELHGGDGKDDYYVDGGDLIHDTDGKGAVYYGPDKIQLTGGRRKAGEILYVSDDKKVIYQELPDHTIIAYTPVGRIEIRADQGYGTGRNGVNGLPDMEIPLITERKPSDLKISYELAERTRSPIVIDLDGNGIQTGGLASGTYFDFDGNGYAERTGWLIPGDGLLVRDLGQNGAIDNGAELFGDQTLLSNGRRAANGYAALADLDGNHDREWKLAA